MALGATPGNVLRLVLSATSRVLLIGLVLGTIVSVVAARFLAGKLEGLDASNPLTIVLVVFVLAISALLACLLPAHSATQIPPTEALRHE